MTKHTQGPWHADQCGVVTGGRTGLPIVCTVPIVAWENAGFPGVAEQMAANARLIAAAPDMLVALRDVAAAYQKHFDVMPVAWQTYDNIVCAAIERATKGA